MADHLASIYGTEKDKVNCSFYFKIGACRHGDRCSRKHVKPTFSQTVLIANVYQNPGHLSQNQLTAEQLQEHFDLFWEDLFIELAKYGEIEELNVCDNIGDHLVGNVYIRYRFEEDAQKSVDSLNNRFYAGRPLYAELSPVTDFREACCRQYENGECTRGGRTSRERDSYRERDSGRERDRERERERDRDRDRERNRDREYRERRDRDRVGRREATPDHRPDIDLSQAQE
ncbi:Splicing factor U2AF 26 kDa subunit, partial [Nowakowskiella sp. JEL0078]